ncbi:hypothetical protein D3C80_1717740 [compost metagenome]
MLAGTLAAHGEDLARQAVAEVALAFIQHVVEVAQRVFVDLEKVGDARRAAEPLDHRLQGFRLADPGLDFQVVPHPTDQQLRIEIAQHRTDVLRQLPDKMLTHRPAFDGDFWKDFNDQFH